MNLQPTNKDLLTYLGLQPDLGAFYASGQKKDRTCSGAAAHLSEHIVKKFNTPQRTNYRQQTETRYVAPISITLQLQSDSRIHWRGHKTTGASILGGK